jgi:hypothetical protein
MNQQLEAGCKALMYFETDSEKFAIPAKKKFLGLESMIVVALCHVLLQVSLSVYLKVYIYMICGVACVSQLSFPYSQSSLCVM